MTREGRSEAMEMYKIAVEMADRVSARRGKANEFYLAIETLLLGIPASIKLMLASADATDMTPWVTMVLGICGTTISAAWWLHLRSYRDLNAAKFRVINQIEADQFQVRLFSDEWEHLKHDPIKTWRTRYAELGAIERFMPLVFALLQGLLHG